MSKATDKLLELVEKNSQLVAVADKRKKKLKEVKDENAALKEHVAKLLAVAYSVTNIAEEAISVAAGEKDQLGRPAEEAHAIVQNLQGMLKIDSFATFGEDVTTLAYQIKQQFGDKLSTHDVGDGNSVMSSHHISEEGAAKIHAALTILFPTAEEAAREFGTDEGGETIVCPIEGNLAHTEDPKTLSDKLIDSLEDLAKKIKHFKDQDYTPDDLEILLPVDFGLAKDDHMHVFGVVAVTNTDTEKPSVVLRTTAEERSPQN